MREAPDLLGFLGLPPVVPIKIWDWDASCGSDLYGALHVAAAYCGLSAVPDHFPGVWQHGAVPPWQQVQPEMCIYCAPLSWDCWVAREDEARYLRQAGYARVRAVGLPIIYTKPMVTVRIPRSLLIMPMHAIPNDPRSTDSDRYLSELDAYRSHFDRVAACVSGRCIDGGLWTRHFEKAGIPVIRGASVDDRNSLQRMRRLFESFEFVTTNSYGSHVPYALHFGAKVSIWGWAEPLTTEYLLRDALWARYPDAAQRYTSEETANARELFLGRFRVPPHLGIEDQALGSRFIGADNKLAPQDLRRAFGWTTIDRLGVKARNVARALLPSPLRSARR